MPGGSMTTDSDHTSNSESTADSVEKFAADLRRLKLDAGSPTLARLQSETGISRTVISDAFAGKTLPSERTVDALVHACQGDQDAWLSRRDSLARTLRGDADGDNSEPDTRAGRPLTRRGGILIGLGAFAGGLLVAGVVAALLLPSLVAAEVSAQSSRARIQVTNGTDPAQTECIDDAKVATGDTRADNSLLEIIWSDKCQAGWGRITRYDGLSMGNTVSISLYPQTAPDGPDRIDVVEQDVQGAYTGLIVRPSDDTLICAEGSFTVDGKRIDLGDPLCI